MLAGVTVPAGSADIFWSGMSGVLFFAEDVS
jgi:hypothetical protein